MPAPRRTVILTALSVLLALVACGGSGGGATDRKKTVRIIVGHLRFVPATITIQAGTTVRFMLANSEPVEHEFVLGSEEVQWMHANMRMQGGHMMEDAGTVNVPASKTIELSYTFSSPGTVIYGCHVDDHYAQGMRGTVTVTA